MAETSPIVLTIGQPRHASGRRHVEVTDCKAMDRCVPGVFEQRHKTVAVAVRGGSARKNRNSHCRGRQHFFKATSLRHICEAKALPVNIPQEAA